MKSMSFRSSPHSHSISSRSVPALSDSRSVFAPVRASRARVRVLAEQRSTLHDAHGRFIAKFLDSDFEKVDRLTELYFEYYTRVSHAERQVATGGGDVDDIFEHKMDAGMHSMRLLAASIAHLAIYSPACRQRVVEKLKQRSHDAGRLAEVIAEFADDLGDEGVLTSETREKQALLLSWAKTVDTLAGPSEAGP